ncbi:MAG: ABC transporter permease [Acutalibacteraceae bacterium]|jgi:spermidine/putrescine transport system permease protein
MKRNRQNILLNSPYIAWSVIFIIVPLIFVVYYAFTDQSGAFTFQNVKDFFTSGIYMPVFGRSVAYAFWATLICLIIGYPFAYCMTKINISAQRMCMLLIMLPMLMNLIVRTYSWRQILENNGIMNKLLTSLGLGSVQFLGNAGIIIFGMVYNYLPFMILPIYSVISKVDRSLTEASADLGCNAVGTMKRVIFPLSIPGVLSGITMVFVPCISTFYISYEFSNGMIKMIGDVIEDKFYKSSEVNYNMGATISLVLMVLILISLAIVNRFSDDGVESGGVVV